MSTLGYALLGLLAREPMTGYDLTRMLDSPIGYMWSAHHSQVYPTLRALEHDKHVRHRVIAGRGPRDTLLYSVTAKGRRALQAWVGSPLPPPESRSEFMLRVRAIWMVSPDVARALIQQARDHHSERLARYLVQEQTFSDDARSDISRPAFAAYATLRCGISNEEHMLSWCHWMSDSLSRGAPHHV